MTALVELRHLHLSGLTSYLRLAALQDRVVRGYLEHKATLKAGQAPFPTLLTFQTPPTYTCGRREIGKLSESQIAHLKAGGQAEFYEALRGGQLTWHGPGQLTAYLIVSLKEHGLDTRSHIALLESVVMATCKHLTLTTHTTENPGVWIGTPPDDRKIASVGVHLRRNIASHGIGLNVSVDLSWFDRIVACGLVGKQATSIEKESKSLYKDLNLPTAFERNDLKEHSDVVNGGTADRLVGPVKLPISIETVANIFATNVAAHLSGVETNVKRVTEDEIWPR